MAFWGCEVKPGKATPFVPPPEAHKLHLSQACLSTKAKPGTKAALKVRVGQEGGELLVCALREGLAESASLDLLFDEYTEFSVEGGASIHLTGYFMPEYEMGHDEEDSDDEGGYGGGILGYDQYGVPIMDGAEFGSDDEFDELESGDEDDSEEEDSEEEDGRPRRSVTIEDVTDRENGRGGRARLALPAPGGGKAAAFEDGHVSASDEEDDEDYAEEGSEDEEESEEEEEEEEEEAPQQPAAKAAAGQKRKAEAAPAPAAKQPPAKAAKQQQDGAAAAAAQQKPAAAAAAAAKTKEAKSKVRTFPNGFEIEDLKQGRPDGKLAKAGKKVAMRYVGRLKSSGKVFDQTRGAATFSFRLGVGEVIKGWDRGVEGMRVGDKRKLTIPPQMAYGTSGVRGTIPPNAWLVFDVELVDVK